MAVSEFLGQVLGFEGDLALVSRRSSLVSFEFRVQVFGVKWDFALESRYLGLARSGFFAKFSK